MRRNANIIYAYMRKLYEWKPSYFVPRDMSVSVLLKESIGKCSIEMLWVKNIFKSFKWYTKIKFVAKASKSLLLRKIVTFLLSNSPWRFSRTLARHTLEHYLPQRMKLHPNDHFVLFLSIFITLRCPTQNVSSYCVWIVYEMIWIGSAAWKRSTW